MGIFERCPGLILTRASTDTISHTVTLISKLQTIMLLLSHKKKIVVYFIVSTCVITILNNGLSASLSLPN